MIKEMHEINNNATKEMHEINNNAIDFVAELIDYIFTYSDDDYMTMECLCRKLHKHGLIDKQDGKYRYYVDGKERVMLNRYDIDKWLDDFMKAKKMLDEDNFDRNFLKGRMNDGIYLATLVEYLMTLEEPDGVLEKARERQRSTADTPQTERSRR